MLLVRCAQRQRKAEREARGGADAFVCMRCGIQCGHQYALTAHQAGARCVREQRRLETRMLRMMGQDPHEVFLRSHGAALCIQRWLRERKKRVMWLSVLKKGYRASLMLQRRPKISTK